MAEQRSDHMDRALYLAVTSNNIDEFKSLISQNIDLLKQRTPMKETVLHLATRLGHLEMVEEICAHQCSFLLTEKDRYGHNPLHTSARYGHGEVVGFLIQHARQIGTSGNEVTEKTMAEEMVEARTNAGHGVLLYAVVNGHLGVVKEVTQAYPNLMSVANENGSSILYTASRKGHLNVVKHILSIDVERSENFLKGVKGSTPLHVAISERHQDVAETLLQGLPQFAKCINDTGSCPLHYAAEMGMLSVVLKLLELYPLAAYQKNKWGCSPLHRAAAGGHLMIFKEIIRFCPDTLFIINARLENVLHLAVRSNELDLVDYILKTPEFEVLLNDEDIDNNTPLFHAVMNDHIWIVFRLLDDCRINLRKVNKDGKFALDVVTSKLEWGIPFSQKAAIWLAINKAGKFEAKEDLYARRKDVWKPNISERWIGTANTLLVVAALIATVSFAAIFTLPGGYVDSGLAHYRKKTLFRMFLVLDGVAMFSSMVAALLVIVANWTDSLGLRAMVPWALKMTALSFLSMCAAFSWAIGLMVKFNWALVLVSFLNAIIVVLIVSFFAFDSPAYGYWRIYVLLKRVKRLVPSFTHICYRLPASFQLRRRN